MNTIILVIVLCGLIFFTIKRKSFGLMFYFAVRLVIPSAARVGNFSFNTVMLAVLLILTLSHIYTCYREYCQEERQYLNSILGLCIGLLSLTFFSPLLTLSYQWGAFAQLVGTEIVPSILLMYYLMEEDDMKLFCYVVMVFTLFSSAYGIFTYFTSSNPIYEFFNTSQEQMKDLDRYASGRYGLTGISVGIYDDKIAMSLISFLLAMFLFDKEIINEKIRYIVVGITLFNMFLTTQRSALFCYLLFMLYPLLGPDRSVYIKKYLSIILPIGLVLLLSDMEIVESFFSSIFLIFDDKAQEAVGIGGSSSSMRFMQYLNVFEYHNLLTIFTGEGYGFSSYYYKVIHDIKLYGLDDRFYGFESFLVHELMNVGIIGCIIWILFFCKIFKILHVRFKLPFMSMFLCYVIVALMTDVSASFYLFFFLIVLNYKYYTIYDESFCLC